MRLNDDVKAARNVKAMRIDLRELEYNPLPPVK